MRGIFPSPCGIRQSGLASAAYRFRKSRNIDSIFFCLLFLALQGMFGCADIELKAKDPQLIALGNFADQATIHLFEMNPNTYEQYQSLLEQDFAPNILAQLKTRGACCKSSAEVKKAIENMQKNNQRCLIHIQSTTFPSQATKFGLVPIEVKGNYIKSVNNISKSADFIVVYMIGNGVKTSRPIVASIEIKKF